MEVINENEESYVTDQELYLHAVQRYMREFKWWIDNRETLNVFVDLYTPYKPSKFYFPVNWYYQNYNQNKRDWVKQVYLLHEFILCGFNINVHQYLWTSESAQYSSVVAKTLDTYLNGPPIDVVYDYCCDVVVLNDCISTCINQRQKVIVSCLDLPKELHQIVFAYMIESIVSTVFK
jgi:hypothetical protein